MATKYLQLSSKVTGPILTSEDEGYAQEIAGFNTATVHSPDVVVVAQSASDVVEAIRYAAHLYYTVTVQCTGHGAIEPITSGMLITTHNLNNLSIDPQTRTATIGAGVRWGAVIIEAAKYGLAPITGSSPNVGVVGFLIGGGVGPLARSHGFGSDYVRSFTVATGAGDLVQASADENPDLFWALRGGKIGFGIVTESKVRLVELPKLYGGNIFYEEDNIEAALRAWITWTATADPKVTTSAFLVNFPPLDLLPPPLRGRRLLNLRFAYPGDAQRGAELAAPFYSFAPVYMGSIEDLPPNKIARIHNDPTTPAPSWVRGMMLGPIDQDFATVLLQAIGKGTNPPFMGVEIRHIGEATKHDVPEGSSVSGRGADYTMGVLATNPALFETEVPTAVAQLFNSVKQWAYPETNMNFVGHNGPYFVRTSSDEDFAKLDSIRKLYDPEGIFG
ncbi:MAG: FAD-binding oxidoreductase [Chloroflexia bacterium]